MGRLRKGYLSLVSKEKERVNRLLEERKIEKVELEELYVVYVTDPLTMEILKKMREEFGDKLKKEGFKIVSNDPYYHIAKLINTDDVAIKYDFSKMKKYIYVKKKESIIKALDKRMEIWANTKRKLAKEACNEHGEDFCQKVARETEDLIKKERSKVEYIKKNIDNLDVLWTNYPMAKEYYVVYYRNIDGVYKMNHIRKGIPNVLQYENVEVTRRRDMKVEKFIESADGCALDQFYFKEKR